MNKDILVQVINTLNRIEVRGKENLDMLLGCINAVQQVIQEESVGEDDGR